MAFSLPSDLATNWQDSVGMIENAAYLNAVGTMNNALKAAVNSTVNGTASAYVATNESTGSTSYVDLTTTTDSVTVTISSSGMALVLIYAALSNGTNGGQCFMSYAVSGSTTVAASDATSINVQVASGAGNAGSFGNMFLHTGLTAGSNTFKLKYRCATGTAYFATRRITVIPFF